MAQDQEANEHTHLLNPRVAQLSRRHGSHLGDAIQAENAESIISSRVSKEEELLGQSAIGERLPYNDYTTIDWLHDLV
jgi:chloride channel 3/4/5